jgi:hypothetical protein
VGLRAFLKKRRQRKARKRYEREKARRELAKDPDLMQRVADLGHGD